MSLSAAVPLGDSGQLLLRWSDSSHCASHEEFVDVLSRQFSKIVVRSISEVAENTPVYLTGKQYAANGTAGSCRKDASFFIIAIRIDNESVSQSVGSGWDPGIMSVENFVTEEQEDEILRNLNRGVSPGSGPAPDTSTSIF